MAKKLRLRDVIVERYFFEDPRKFLKSLKQKAEDNANSFSGQAHESWLDIADCIGEAARVSASLYRRRRR